jgi:Arc/MetJ-type ribon-helix-helix transcriptional regulator
MSTQIAVRLPDEVVAFLDREVSENRAPSRAAVVLGALERERRRQIALRDAAILAATEPDQDLAALAEFNAQRAADID